MNLKRIHRLFVREVTEDLPVFPDWETGETAEGRVYTEPHPYRRGRWFYVEIHVSNFGWFGPLALGIVSTDEHEKNAEMSSMWVLDNVRQEGYGRQLIESAGQRWPDLQWTHCTESLPFHERLVEQGIAKRRGRGSMYFQFVPKERRLCPTRATTP